MSDRATILVHHQFDDLAQQRRSYTFGIWAFLATEVLFFGGMFTLYTIYRLAYYKGWVAGSGQMDLILGTVNTAVLLTSSLTMALSIAAVRENKRWNAIGLMLLTMLLGTVFMVIKGFEYYHHFADHQWPDNNFRFPGPYAHPARLFFSLYFVMTGIHAVHLLIGIALVGVMMLYTAFGRMNREYHDPLEMAGLYWHFVDIIWVFLYPLFYLVG